jgi:group I intron endonuclease
LKEVISQQLLCLKKSGACINMKYMKEKSCKIYYCYKATNKVNGKTYIGFATDPQKRWRQHKADAIKNKGFVFAAAIRKHGWENFEFEVICGGKEKRAMLEIVEPALIEQYHSSIDQNGYNIRRCPVIGFCGFTKKTIEKLRDASTGANNPFYGKRHTEETRQIMSALKKGKPSHRKGATHTEESKQKMRAAHLGIICSEEHKAKTSAALLGIKRSDEFKQKMRVVAANRPAEHYIRKIQCNRNIAKLAGLQFFEDKPHICGNIKRYTSQWAMRKL